MDTTPKSRAKTILAFTVLAAILAGCWTTAVRQDGAAVNTGSFIDKRDGKAYRTVKIGKQTWMAENLNFATGSSMCYDNADSNCTKYGRLYTWDDAMTACPAPWRVPLDDDWDNLAWAVGSRLDDDGEHWIGAGKKLKSKDGWEYAIWYGRGDTADTINGNGTDEFGFSALPGGGRFYRFSDAGKEGFWWSAAEGDTNYAWNMGMYNYNGDLFRNHYEKSTPFSLRCVKGAARKKGAKASGTVKTVDAADTVGGTFTDPRDGNTYRTVRIGNLNWMAENLNYDMYASRCMTPDGRGADEDGCQILGRFYNWNDAMKACPAPWRAPTDEDWDNLAAAVGGKRREQEEGGYNWAIAGKKLKTATGWPDCESRSGHSLSGNGTNEYGFSALPAGFDHWNHFYCLHYSDKSSGWWSAAEGDAGCVWARRVDCDDGTLSRSCGSKDISNLKSLRCVADTGSLAVRQEAAAQIADAAPAADTIVQTTGNRGAFADARDGKTYRTVKIGKQRWMAENLNFKVKGSYCYGDDESYCQKYGRLYQWNDAMKACPAGWRAPSEEDWDKLAVAVGGKLWVSGSDYYWSLAGTKLKSTTGWIDRENGSSGNGTDEFGFSALPLPGSGFDWRYTGWKDAHAGKYGRWWSSTGAGCSSRAYIRRVSYEYGYMDQRLIDKDGFSLSSLRCIEGAAPANDIVPAAPDTAGGAFTDPRDGKTYRVMRIGKTTWMAENLNFKTGQSLCYDNADSNCTKYGRLYDRDDAMAACPAGWRMPGDADWASLAQTVDAGCHKYRNVAGEKLKSKTGWITNGNGTDEYGFSALPGGFAIYSHNNTVKFSSIGGYSSWWNAADSDSSASSRNIMGSGMSWSRDYKAIFLHSLRCVQDTASSR